MTKPSVIKYQMCGCGRCMPNVIRRRQNTQYMHEESNWVTCCDECFEEIEEYWAERWAEYYNGRL